jgi:cytochrome P450
MPRRASVEPMPPRAGGPLPFVRGGLRFIRAPTEFLNAARKQHGDTFLLEAFGFELLMTFSPTGLRNLYSAPERAASFTEATRTLIGFKVPAELLAGDMQLFHKLFARERMPSYLDAVRDAVHEDIDALGRAGEVELFARAKLLVHRIGFRCWVGPEAASPSYLARLQASFDRLDPEAAFVRPHTIFWTLLTRKAPERRALREVEAVLREIWATRERSGALGNDMLATLHAQYAALPEQERMLAVARDVMILHLASLTNLYAALAWTLVNLLTRPELLEQARRECEALATAPAIDVSELAGLETLDAVAHESIRMAQRSITLRRILEPCELDDGKQVYTLQPGVLLATMLSVTNAEYGDLDRFDPTHYRRGRLVAQLPAKEVVSTFGHGTHACPGQRFAIMVIKLAVAGYLNRLELEPLFEQASAPPEQMGAVARAAKPCSVRYRAR